MARRGQSDKQVVFARQTFIQAKGQSVVFGATFAMSSVAFALFAAISMAFEMGWEILWPLIFGFALSGVVQAVVSKGEMSKLLPDSSPRSIVIASALAVLLLCRCGAGAIAFPQGGRFYRGDGVPIRFDAVLHLDKYRVRPRSRMSGFCRSALPRT
jgi:hypothetical protein